MAAARSPSAKSTAPNHRIQEPEPSSAGLGVLLKTQKRLLGSGGKLRLAGVTRHLQDILEYSGFDQIFEIVPNG